MEINVVQLYKDEFNKINLGMPSIGGRIDISFYTNFCLKNNIDLEKVTKFINYWIENKDKKPTIKDLLEYVRLNYKNKNNNIVECDFCENRRMFFVYENAEDFDGDYHTALGRIYDPPLFLCFCNKQYTGDRNKHAFIDMLRKKFYGIKLDIKEEVKILTKNLN